MKNKLLSISFIALFSLTSCEEKKSYFNTAEENAIIQAVSTPEIKEEVKPKAIKFHSEVRVCPYNDYWFSIYFTNDDWATEEIILDSYYPGHIQEKAYDSKTEALMDAKTLNTYKKCVHRNQKELKKKNQGVSNKETKIKVY